MDFGNYTIKFGYAPIASNYSHMVIRAYDVVDVVTYEFNGWSILPGGNPSQSFVEAFSPNNTLEAIVTDLRFFADPTTYEKDYI